MIWPRPSPLVPIIYVTFLLIAVSIAAPESKVTRDDLFKTLQHIDQHAKALQNDLADEKDNELKIAQSLSLTSNALSIATQQNADLQKKIDSAVSKANKWIADKEHVMKKYHTLKWIASIIAAGIAVLIVMQFGGLIPPPYNIYAMVAGGGAATTAVWVFL
jgi:biopolymer transport protein ExbB/TolQ